MVDDFIGTFHGKDGHLEVVERFEKVVRNGTIKYRVECSVCSLDRELFSEPFLITKAHLKSGRIPCACSSKHNLNERQVKVKVERRCEILSYTFRGFVDNFNGSGTKLKLVCSTHNHSWESTDVIHFIGERAAKGCIKCAINATASSKVKPDNLIIKTFTDTGKFPTGTTFSRVVAGKSMWNIWCPVCAKDKFSNAGVSTGNFLSEAGNLRKGQMPCRCAEHHIYTSAEKVFQIQEHITTQNLPYEFVDWVSGFKDSKSKFILNCPVHGYFTSSSYFNFVHGNNGCPSCAKHGYKRSEKATLYVLKVINHKTGEDFTGYGITNNTEQRLKRHIKNLNASDCEIVTEKLFAGMGGNIYDIEQLVRKQFIVFPQNIEGFIREATLPEYYHEVCEFVRHNIETLEAGALLVGQEEIACKTITTSNIDISQQVFS